MKDRGLIPGDLVTLCDVDNGPLPVFGDGDVATDRLYAGNVAVIVCVSLPPFAQEHNELIEPIFPLLLPNGRVGWILDPYCLRAL